MGIFCSCTKHQEHENNLVCSSYYGIKHFDSIDCDNIYNYITLIFIII